MQSDIWTISNVLSSFRIILLIPLSLLLLSDNPDLRWYIIGLMIFIASTDMLDGYFARRFQQVSEIGKILDPLADKIAIGVVCLILTVQCKIPSWFFFTAILRDVIIFMGGIYIKKSKDIILESNKIGKWAVTIFAVYLILVVIDHYQLEYFKGLFLCICFILLITSFISYAVRFIKIIRMPQSIHN